LLDGRENLKDDEIGDDEDGIEIADCEDFFLINYTNRGAVSPYFANLVIDIAIVKTASTY
jgi:hypothetical protein